MTDAAITPEEPAAGAGAARTDRLRAGLKRRYGDKPVIYPPMPEHSWELKSN